MSDNTSSPRIRPLKAFVTVFLVVFLVAFVIDTIKTALDPKIYACSARLKVEPNLAGSGGVKPAQALSSVYDPYLVETEVETIKSELILKNTVEELDLPEIWGKKYAGTKLHTHEAITLLRSSLDVAPVHNTSLIQIRVYDDNPKEGAEIANAILRVYSRHAALTPDRMQVQLVDSAYPAARPIRPNLPFDLAFGVIWSALLAVLAGSIVGGLLLRARHRALLAPVPVAAAS